jgi:drug/metabolite transporter (DMT)-like permease
VVWTISATIYSFIIVLITGLRKKLSIPKRSIAPIFILGISTAAGMLLGWAGLALLDPSFASFIWRFFPVLTIVLCSIFLKERFTPIEIAPIAIMVIGGAISAIGRWNLVGTGIVLTIAACLAASIQMLIAKVKVTEIHPNVLVFYRVGIAALMIVVWTFSIGKADFHAAPRYWLITMLGAFLGPCASFLFMFRSYRYWGLSRSSIVHISQPLFVLPMAYVFLQRIPTSRGLTGGFLILAGAFWLAWIHFRGKKGKEAKHAPS